VRRGVSSVQDQAHRCPHDTKECGPEPDHPTWPMCRQWCGTNLRREGRCLGWKIRDSAGAGCGGYRCRGAATTNQRFAGSVRNADGCRERAQGRRGGSGDNARNEQSQSNAQCNGDQQCHGSALPKTSPYLSGSSRSSCVIDEVNRSEWLRRSGTPARSGGEAA
jgi:hypothetical protein